MGAIWSYVWWSNEPDPATGLTPREKHLVVSSFNLIKKDMTGVGIQLFLMFFDRKPEYQDYFPFRDIPRDVLPKTPKFKAHCVTVMYAIASIVENLDNPEVLVNLLQKTGSTHAARNLPVESFSILNEEFLKLIEKNLGPSLGKEGLDAWEKTLDIAFKLMKDAMQ